MRRVGVPPALGAAPMHGDIIAGLSAPSFVIVAAALTLTLAVLAGQVESSTSARPAAIRAAAPVGHASELGPPTHAASAAAPAQ